MFCHRLFTFLVGLLAPICGLSSPLQAQELDDPNYFENSFQELEDEWKQRQERNRLKQLKIEQEIEKDQLKEEYEESEEKRKMHGNLPPIRYPAYDSSHEVTEAEKRYKDRQKEIDKLQGQLEQDSDSNNGIPLLFDPNNREELEERLMELSTESDPEKRQQILDEMGASPQAKPTSPMRQQFFD